MKLLSIIKKIIKKMMPIKNVILFESYPDFSDSVINVYDKLKEIGIDKKYKFIWYSASNEKNIYFKTTHNQFLRSYYLCSSKFMITSNRILNKSNRRQTIFYISHGNPVKVINDYYCFKEPVDYFICFSKYLEKNNSIQMHQPISSCYGLGLPRNDKLLNSINLKEIFGNFKKFIFWYPTVKTFKGGRTAGNGESVPFLKNEIDIKKINNEAKKLNICLIVKIHFANKTDSIKGLSNIKIVDDAFYYNLGIDHYSCVGSGDALISDYSSIFYDYLYVNKPICLVWNDVEEYRKNPGLIDEFYYEDSNSATVVKNVNGLVSFMNDISNNIDKKALERQKLINLCVNKKNNSITSDVCDFIVKKIESK